MAKVSVIVPSRNELFLPQTVADILVKATGDVEVIVVLDGYWPNPFPPQDPRVSYIHPGRPKGMRWGINAAAAVAKGEFLLKCDAHCLFGEGFDEILQADCEEADVVIPRRYSLNAEEWALNPKECIDYEYIFYPFTPGHEHEPGLHARPWYERGRARRDILIDEDMSFQGSCWFMRAEHFHKRLEGLSEVGYETFMGEPQEIGFKTQLGPWRGRVMRNKKTYYAHLHKGKTYGRMYHMSQSERVLGNAYSFDFWWNNRWEKRVHNLSWLIEKFWPVPTWPENWRDIIPD